MASEIERLNQDPGSPPLLPVHGGVSPRERSHAAMKKELAQERAANSLLRRVTAELCQELEQAKDELASTTQVARLPPRLS